MWCPGCNSESPTVVVLHSGIVCARCEVEVLSVRPARTAKAGNTTVAKTGTELSESSRKLPPISAGVALGTPVFRFDAAHPVTGKNGNPTSQAPSTQTKKRAVPELPASPQAERKKPGRPLTGRPRSRATATSGTVREPGARRWRSDNPGSANLPSTSEVSATRSLLVFFAGQFLIAWAWAWSSFPAFAAGVLLTLAGTGFILQGLHRLAGRAPSSESGKSNPVPGPAAGRVRELKTVPHRRTPN